MLSLWLAAVLIPAVLAEFFFGQGTPRFWDRARWYALPAIGMYSGWTMPLGVLRTAPHADLALSIVFGALVACLIGVGGLFAYRFKSGPSPQELARSGRRSAIIATMRQDRAR